VLHYPAQLRAADAPAAGRGGAGADELDLACRLIDAASPTAAPWAEYRDDTAEALAALVEAALRGRPVPGPDPAGEPALHLLDALKRSVAEALDRDRPAAPAGAAGSGRRGPKAA